MAVIQFDEQQQSLINRNSSIIPDNTEEFESNRFEALGRTMNNALAFSNQQSYYQNTYDTSPYEGVQFTRSNIRAQLTDQGVDPEIIDEVMTSNVNSWEDVMRRVDYLTDHYRDQRQIAEQFSTVGQLAYGLPMAILDPSMVLLGPIAGGVGKGLQFANLATRLGRLAPTVQYGLTGGIEAVADNMLYEGITGVHEDNSSINAALIGMALGGTLGTFVGRSAQNTTSSFSDSAGRPLQLDEVGDSRLANALDEQDEISALIQEANNLRREAETPPTARNPNDPAPVYSTVQSARSNIEELRAATRDNTTQSRQLNTEARSQEAEVARSEARLSNVRRMAAEIEEVSSTITRTSDALAIRKQFPDGLPSKTRFINERVEAYRLSGDNSRTVKAVRAEAGTEYARLRGAVGDLADTTTSVLRARVAKAERKLKKLNKKASKVFPNGDTAKVISDMERMLTANQNKALMKRTKKDDLDKTREALRNQEAEAQKTIDDSLATLAGREVQVGDRVVPFKELIDKYGVDLSPQSLKKLAQRQNTLKTDIEKMLDGKTSGLSSDYGVAETKGNFVSKLNDELQDYDNNLNDLTKSDGWKRVNPFLQKILISPIEKLFASSSDLVVGFSRKLHAGTVHHGKADTHNAFNIKKSLDAYQNQAMHRVRADYHKALEDGSFSGTLTEWHEEVGREAFRTASAIQRRAYTDYNGAVSWQERLQLAKEKVAGAGREYSTDNKHLRSSVDTTLDYFEGIHRRGVSTGMSAFQGSLGKGYVKRIYSRRGVETLGREASIERLVDAQEKFAIATNKPWGPEEIADAKLMATAAVDAALDPSAMIKTITQPLGVTKGSNPSALKQRTIEVFDDDIVDLLETNIDGLTSVYGLNVHGRLGLQQAIGVSDDAGIEDILQRLGATPREQDLLRIVIDSVKGVRELDKNPAAPQSRIVKGLSSFSSVMHSAAFGVTSVTEFAAIAGEYGLTRTLSNLVGAPQDVYNLYRKGTVADKNQIDLLLSYGDAHFSNRANRYDADTGFDSVGKAQAFLDRAQHYTSVYGGLLPVTDGLRMTTGSMTVDFLARLSVQSKISSADLKRLGDAGFSEADLPRIRETLGVTPDGRITNMERSTWGTLDDDINYAVQTMVDRVILDPNGATLPAIMTDMNGGGWVPRIFGKFLRFPVESYERMLVRGVQEMDARRAIGFAANATTWYAILAAKDAVRGEERKLYNEEGGQTQLLIDALMYSTMVGGVATFADLAAGITTGRQITNDYSYRFGGVVLSDVIKVQSLARGLLTGDADAIRRGPTFSVPFANIRIGEGVAAALTTLNLIEETNK